VTATPADLVPQPRHQFGAELKQGSPNAIITTAITPITMLLLFDPDGSFTITCSPNLAS
jgi:hypothetical protein